ncbi:tRNA(fMet)-specific endonuclease VapC [Candidatus Methylomirabilis lanthanidiphila]|uniref:tRNA(fMet)-specific endonuclease VapC n=1 Tax=Candidatus Methylomirabilis lanthanidiphila TaxID=2211376 RepID=A0A564ZJ16_9BACT|nr:type II toxin-antitoxin system VapC family toxin [Candidatus Methylomirabilis lanthanidiphila]VUZ85086.1 tRNA(fMet)-specific endonuclease VapC [Candidatus Methylomirabilis lanthanidiphila]
MYLFDTDTISNLLTKRPSPGLVRRLAGIAPRHQFTSAITVGELTYGAFRSARPDYFLHKLDQLVWPNVTILAFDEAAARVYGSLRAELERGGIPISEPDLRIASIALVHQLTVITGNIRHFSRISSLRVENWLR